MAPRPMDSMAAIMRPLRPSTRSAIATMRLFGVAVGEARRNSRAMVNSHLLVLSEQAAI
jgi:hypothetical protein